MFNVFQTTKRGWVGRNQSSHLFCLLSVNTGAFGPVSIQKQESRLLRIFPCGHLGIYCSLGFLKEHRGNFTSQKNVNCDFTVPLMKEQLHLVMSIQEWILPLHFHFLPCTLRLLLAYSPAVKHRGSAPFAAAALGQRNQTKTGKHR